MSTLLINEPPLLVSPTLAMHVGLNEAIVLQQVHYWLTLRANKTVFGGRRWVWNTYEQWRKQFPFWSEATIRRIIWRLEEIGLLISGSRRGFQKIKHYTIDYARLQALSNLNSQSVQDEPIEEVNFGGLTGQNDLTDQNGLIEEDNPDRLTVQNEPIDQVNLDSITGQNGLLDRVNLTRSYTENTSETSSEILLPPLTPPSAPHEAKEDEEEEKMISIWNEVVQSKINPEKLVFLTAGRKKALMNFEQAVLENQGIAFEDYCRKIAKTKFLLGENASGFKVSLDWALMPEKAFKILEGAIYDKPAEKTLDQSQAVTKAGLLEELGTSFPSGCLVSWWEKVLEALMDKLELPVIRSWFTKTGLVGLSEHTAIVQIDTQFKLDWITSHYSKAIEQAVIAVCPNVKRVEFIWRAK